MPHCSRTNWPHNRGFVMGDAVRLDNLVKRLRHLSAGDRKAIIARLSLEQRFALDARLAAKPAEQAPPVADVPPTPDNQMFSTILAKMLDRIDDGGEVMGGNGAPLTPTTRAALQQTATQIRDDIRKNKPENAGMLRAFVQQFLFAERS